MVGMSKAKPEPRALPKRFYAHVSLQQKPEGFVVLLDGRELRTQGRHPMVIASQQLAQQIAAEWDAQREVVNPDTMPLTRLMNIAVDRMPSDRLAALEQLCAYGETDLVCYREPESALRERQAAAFDPLIDWVRAQYGIGLGVTQGVMPVVQSTASLAQLREVFATATDRELAALAMLVPLLGSAVLALAVWKGRVGVEDAIAAAHLDEAFQAEQWGEDADAMQMWENKCRDIRASAFFLTCK